MSQSRFDEKGRALRRHHVARLKSKRARNNQEWLNSPNNRNPQRTLGLAVHTACPCSCAMCGNPRRYFGESTIQERREQQVEKCVVDQDDEAL